MNAIGLRTQDLVKRFGGLRATDGVTLEIEPGELHAIIGPNGAGKTTLINLLTGELRSDEGSIVLGGEEVSGTPVQQRVGMGLLQIGRAHV